MATRNSIGSNKPLEVPFGSTAASTHTANGVLQGNGVNPVTTINASANGQTLIGANTGVSIFNTITAGPNITVVNGANTITVNYTGGGTGVVTNWTPSVSIAPPANVITPPTYSVQNGKYILFGKLAIYTAEITLTSKGTVINVPPPSNDVGITGLPFFFNSINNNASPYTSQWAIELNAAPDTTLGNWTGLSAAFVFAGGGTLLCSPPGQQTFEYFGQITNTNTYRICGINFTA